MKATPKILLSQRQRYTRYQDILYDNQHLVTQLVAEFVGHPEQEKVDAPMMPTKSAIHSKLYGLHEVT